MKRHATFVVIAILITAAGADAQPATDQFSRLNDFLRLGDGVILTELSGRTIAGTLQTLRPESMDVRVGGKPRTILGRDLSMVRLRKGDSLINGTVVGGLVGLGVGAVWGAALAGDGNEIVNTVGLLGTICGVAGVGIGAAVDSSVSTDVPVYRRPRATAIVMSMRF
jgi:hypothetical protein